MTDRIVPSKHHKMVQARPRARPHGPENGQKKKIVSSKTPPSRTKTGRAKQIMACFAGGGGVPLDIVGVSINSTTAVKKTLTPMFQYVITIGQNLT
jgi:hypothetical protein